MREKLEKFFQNEEKDKGKKKKNYERNYVRYENQRLESQPENYDSKKETILIEIEVNIYFSYYICSGSAISNCLQPHRL